LGFMAAVLFVSHTQQESRIHGTRIKQPV
jgi:hypothetical protein